VVVRLQLCLRAALMTATYETKNATRAYRLVRHRTWHLIPGAFSRETFAAHDTLHTCDINEAVSVVSEKKQPDRSHYDIDIFDYSNLTVVDQLRTNE
jgi:hypothetical protein